MNIAPHERESQNQMKIVLILYMVPQNPTKELCNAMTYCSMKVVPQ